MDIRTWQQADRPDLPEPGFDEDPAVHGALGAAQPAPGGLGAFAAPGTATAFAADVISLGPAERPARGGRS
ncbi:MAG: hypothetical protein HOW97_00895, partial [Catenulispora sp.]|nr:hypothetical protein [Catenulispora sp.]